MRVHAPALTRLDLVGAAMAGALALVLGAAIGSASSSARMAEVLAGLATVAVIARLMGRGGVYGLLIFAAVDLLPGIDTATRQLHGGFFLSDLASYGLIALLLIDCAARGFAPFRVPGVIRTLGVWSAVMLGAWALNVLRSWAFDGAQLLHAVRFGEYIVYFAALTPLLAAALCDHEVRTNALKVTGAFTLVVATAAMYAGLRPGTLQFLLHSTTQLQDLGSTLIVRTYADSADSLALLALPFGVGAALLATTRWVRLTGALVSALCIGALAAALTRAFYVGAIVALVVPTVIWIFWSGSDLRLKQRVALSTGIVAAACALLIWINPPFLASSTFSVAASRLESIPAALVSKNVDASTVAYRESETAILERYLGSRWPVGLGFLDPRDRYFVGLPSWDGGSIHDTDVGVLNTVMTMGVLGSILQSIPIFMLGWLLIRRRRESRANGKSEWLAFGGLGALAALTATGVTLVIFFDPTTIVLCALLIAVCAVTLSDPKPGTEHLAGGGI
jgi:hypothetical protein